MRLIITLLAFVGETAGDTFFINYETPNQTLFCHTSSHSGRTDWWFGDGSMQKFRRTGEDLPACPTKQHENNPCYTEGKELISAFPHGQVVACRPQKEKKTPQVPLFTNEDHCREFDFFILANTKQTEQKTLQVTGKKFSLPCEFKLEKKVANFAVYWIKKTDWTTCLLSVSNEDQYQLTSFSYNSICCIDANVKNRILNSSKIIGSEGRHQNHELSITDVTPSDSGIYLCVVTMFAQPQNWTIVTNTSVIVEEPSSSSALHISLGIVAGIVLISGLVLLLHWRRTTKATVLEPHQRDCGTAEREDDGDCSPYAVCSSKDIQVEGNQGIYSLAMSPGVNPNRTSSLLEEPASKDIQVEGNQGIYSLAMRPGVNPNRTSSLLEEPASGM